MDAHLNCTSICKSVHALGTRELRAPASEGEALARVRPEPKALDRHGR